MLERSINTSNHCHEKNFRSNFLLNLKFACCVPVFQRLSTGWVNTAIYYVRLPPLQNDNFSKHFTLRTGEELFYFVEKLSSVLKIFKSLYFYPFLTIKKQGQ